MKPTGVWDPGVGTRREHGLWPVMVEVRTPETDGWVRSVAKAKPYYDLLTIHFLGGVHSEQ